MSQKILTASPLAALLLLSGCAVTPNPLTMAEIQPKAAEDVKTLNASQSKVTGLLTPEMAVARALLYNRDRHVKTMQSALRSQQLDAANYDMLPSLTARAGYTTRSEYEATQSVPFVDGEPSNSSNDNSYSISQERNRKTYGVDFTWSILDFGLSYVRANQSADQYLISVEEERKAVQNLAQEVRTAYWKSVSADRLLNKVEPLMVRVNESLERSRTISRQRLSNPLDSYSYERSLLDVKRSLDSLRNELIGAREKLASLMGLPPTTTLELPQYDTAQLKAPKAKLDVATMEQTALLMRPEVLTTHYRERIARDEVRSSLLKMFPDLSFSASYSYDDNQYLLFQDWTSAGAAVSYDLLNVFQAKANKEAAETSVEITREERLATSLAVLTQVHLAQLKYVAADRDLGTAQNYLQVSRNISDLVTQQSRSGSIGELTAIKEQLNSLIAELRRDLAYAQIQNAYARVYQSIGLDPYPKLEGTAEPAQLASALVQRRQDWDDGQIGVVVEPISEQSPILKQGENGEAPSFSFDANTFAVAGSVHYSFSTPAGEGLPQWLTFSEATRTFTAVPGSPATPVTIMIKAENEKGVYALDRFVLAPDSSLTEA